MKLKSSAVRLFAERGIRSTTVADITKAAGIAKGSFYSFYSSKEALLMSLLDEIEEAARDHMFREINALESLTPDAVAEIVLAALVRAGSDPLLAAVLADPNINSIFRALPGDEKGRLVSGDAGFMAEISGLLAGKGLEAAVAPAVAAGMFKSIFLAMAAPDEIGRDVHREVVRELVRAVCAAVFRTSGKENRP